MPQNDTPKRGRKARKEKPLIDAKLEELFFEDGTTPRKAAKIAGCGYKYALAFFENLGAQLADSEGESWIERNERVRKRALEGFSEKLAISKKRVEFVEKQIQENIMVQEAFLGKALDALKESPVGQALLELFEQIDQKVLFQVVGVLRDRFDQHKGYGFLIAQLIREKRAEEIFITELQQQYDGIELMPPPKAVIEAELEKIMAAKQNMFRPAVTPQER